MEAFFLIFIFILGLSIGSFLNVLIYRLPRSLKLTGRSFCPKCKKKIRWYDNVPLLSFFLLRGRCRFCRSPISVLYPVVELLTGGLFLLTVFLIPDLNSKFQIPNSNYLLIFTYYLFLISSLIVIFFTDLKHRIIPDQIIYPTILITLLYQITSNQLLITNHFFAAFGAGLFFLILHLITRGKGMGFGDVKLAFLMGLILGPAKVIFAFYLAFLTGALTGVILILAKKKKFGEQIPFGPFLSGATIITLFWGEEIIKWLTAHLF